MLQVLTCRQQLDANKKKKAGAEEDEAKEKEGEDEDEADNPGDTSDGEPKGLMKKPAARKVVKEKAEPKAKAKGKKSSG